MFLRDMISQFVKTSDFGLLRDILKQHGRRGFNLACRAAGIRRGEAHRRLRLYNDNGPIHEVAKAACGLKTTNWG
ncbi:MAG TPA: hypothetical protein GXX50_06915 [Firmicutes bacterium]|nr:hypothetical protein [Bacillota bacterium]